MSSLLARKGIIRECENQEKGIIGTKKVGIWSRLEAIGGGWGDSMIGYINKSYLQEEERAKPVGRRLQEEYKAKAVIYKEVEITHFS